MASKSPSAGVGATDIWALVQKLQQEDRKKRGSELAEPNIAVLGGHGAGKTTIIQTLMFREGGAGKSGGSSAPQPTTSLDYKYLRQGSTSNAKVSHIWELGGGRGLAKLLDIAVNAETVPKSGIIIVVDLSKPCEMIDDLNFWLRAATRRVREILDKVAQKKPRVPKMLMERAQARLGEKHQDALALQKRICSIPLLIVANKFDKFKNVGVEKLRVAARTLRAIAHCNGAGLVYVDKSVSGTRQALLAHLAKLQRIQRGEEEKESKRLRKKDAVPMNIKDLEAVSISMGEDSLKEIGTPSNLPRYNAKTLLDDWLSTYRETFPKSPSKSAAEMRAEDSNNVELDPEAAVDTMLTQKNVQVKQMQRGNALARKMAAAGGKT